MADNAEGSSDPQITFKVKTSGDGNHVITMAETATVLDLKTKLAGTDFENIPTDRQRLIYSGRVMKNDDTLSTYKIKAGNTIHLVKSAASNPAPAPSAASAPPPQAIPSNMAAGTSANNLLAGLTGARFAGHANLPGREMFGADGGMGAPPSEEQMAEMLSNPAIAQTMNEALNNPQIVDFMIQQNPMLRNMPNAREMIQSPYFRQMITNPEALRMASQMRRMMGGNQGAGDAFPAPGATDSTPTGAPAAGGEGDNAQNPMQFPNLFGNPGMFGAPGGAPGSPNANPFNALFNSPYPFGMQGQTGVSPTSPPAGQQAAAEGTAQRDAGATTNTAGTTSPPPAGGANAAANPFASLFGPPPTQGGAGVGAANPFGLPPLSPEMMQQFMQMMGGGGGAGGAGAGGFGSPTPASPPDNRPPEERYADQLRQLNEMGFYDFDRNVSALRRSGGSVQGAIEHLLSG